jgi:LysR family transcriptional activator for leuABCD operon
VKLNLRAIDLNLLTIFDAIMLEGKLSKAALRLHMSQPAVSQALGRLRQTVGDELFIRTHSGMKPTARAAALAGPIRSILAQIKDALDPQQNFDPTQSTHAFKVNFGAYGEFSILPPLLKRIHQQQTAINIQSINSENSIAQLRSGDLDVSFIPYNLRDDNFEVRKFGSTEFVVIARRQHPRLRGSFSLEDYAREKHVLVRSNERYKGFSHQELMGLRKSRRIMTEVHNIASIPQVISHTDAVAAMPRALAEFFQQQHPIEVYPFPMSAPSTSIYLTWHKSMNMDKGHQWLRDIIMELSIL